MIFSSRAKAVSASSAILLLLLLLPIWYQLAASLALLIAFTAMKRESLQLAALLSLGFALPLVAFDGYLILRLPAYRCALPWNEGDKFVSAFEPQGRGECHKSSYYSFQASIDPKGRRSNGEPGTATSASKNVLMLGCSFTFGLGVNDNETLAAQLEKLSQGKIRAFNLGVPGGGIQHAIQILSKISELAPELQDSPAPIAVYTMLPDHLHRLSYYGSWSWLNNGYDKYLSGEQEQLRTN